MASEFGRLSATLQGEATRFEVWPDQPVTLGRSPECTVQLRDTKVSREHCRLSLRDGRVFVTDLDSTHGLVHQGNREAEFELDVGDGFHLGETFVRYDAREEAAPHADAAAPAPTRARPRGSSQRSGIQIILRFAVVLAVQLVIFLLYAAVVIVLLLAVKLKWPEYDVYKLMDWGSSLFR